MNAGCLLECFANNYHPAIPHSEGLTHFQLSFSLQYEVDDQTQASLKVGPSGEMGLIAEAGRDGVR